MAELGSALSDRNNRSTTIYIYVSWSGAMPSDYNHYFHHFKTCLDQRNVLYILKLLILSLKFMIRETHSAYTRGTVPVLYASLDAQ